MVYKIRYEIGITRLNKKVKIMEQKVLSCRLMKLSRYFHVIPKEEDIELNVLNKIKEVLNTKWGDKNYEKLFFNI